MNLYLQLFYLVSGMAYVLVSIIDRYYLPVHESLYTVFLVIVLISVIMHALTIIRYKRKEDELKKERNE